MGIWCALARYLIEFLGAKGFVPVEPTRAESIKGMDDAALNGFVLGSSGNNTPIQEPPSPPKLSLPESNLLEFKPPRTKSRCSLWFKITADTE